MSTLSIIDNACYILLLGLRNICNIGLDIKNETICDVLDFSMVCQIRYGVITSMFDHC